MRLLPLIFSLGWASSALAQSPGLAPQSVRMDLGSVFLTSGDILGGGIHYEYQHFLSHRWSLATGLGATFHSSELISFPTEPSSNLPNYALRIM
ncbi:MAG: DUF3575 domain-containing protein [Bernardetiaceae bacterium]|jgi:hypothetical protein|nr:DUF3575 domain-containing protein [Bernardetiaceae bacterium]